MNEYNDLIQVNVTTVPWFNKKEWMTIFDFLYSQTPQRVKAMKIIKMWKMRHPRLPAGIEATYILLQVLEKPLQDIDEYDMQVLFSTAILRFSNLVAHDKVQGTFSRIAKQSRIPEWIIDMRHEIAHGVNLPNLDLLKKACEFCDEWLYNSYWLPVSKLLRDYVFEIDVKPMYQYLKSSLNNQEDILTQSTFLLDFFECIVIFQHPKFKVQTINDIPDPECRENLLKDLKNFKALFLVSDDTNLTELSKSVIFALHGCLSMAKTDTKKQIVDTLLNGIGFLCEEDLQMKLFESTSLEILPWNYVSLWLELLQIFCKFSMLEYLLIKLFNIISNQNENKDRKRMASLWVIEIAKALKKVQFCQIVYETKLNVINPSIKSNREECTKYIIEKTESVHPTLKHIMTFDPETEIPSVVSNFKKFSKIVLQEPNEYVKLCLPFILELNTPKLDSDLTSQLHQLINKFTSIKSVENTNEGKSFDESVYSIEDLKKYIGDKMPEFERSGINDDLETMDSDDSTSIIDYTSEKDDLMDEDFDESNHWRKASEHLNFKNCPLGLLPWQDKNKNPVLQTFIES